MKKPNDVPFNRKFIASSDSKNIAYESEFEGLTSSRLQWKDLLSYFCVVVLSEGRCGKTHEFRQQHQIRLSNGQFSFFVPLEQLQNGAVEDILSPAELRAFEKWKNTPQEEATFFLDAVDELKIRLGTLRIAIRKLINSIKTPSHNAKFFISCRPADWSQDEYGELDVDTVRELLPAPVDIYPENEGATGEDLFVHSVCPAQYWIAQDENEPAKGKQTYTVQVVHLLPLSTKEIREFAQLASPHYAHRFLEHVHKHDLWHLYKLPIDIIEALNLLQRKGPTETLGNLMELLDWGITQRIREISTKKRNVLAEEETRETAERTALALSLTKQRSFVSTAAQQKLPGELCLADITTNWNQVRQEEFLHKPLFTPTSVDRFRFYHRTTEEYLAAKKLVALVESGLCKIELYTLLFGDVGSEQVVIPSMEPIAAWLAVMDTDIFAEIKNRKPQLLLLQHFPTLLDIPRRAALITAFVDKYSGSQLRNLGLGWQDYERLASPELGPTVKQLWKKAFTGYETRELLLRLIASANMPECANLAHRAALDKTLPEHQRIFAIWGVFKSGSQNLKRKLALDILAGQWPQSIVIRVLTSIYPGSLTVSEFVDLISAMECSLIEPFGVSSAVLHAIQSMTVPRQEMIIVRDNITSLVSDVSKVVSNYLHLVPALMGACSLTVPDLSSKEDSSAWARSVVISLSLGYNQIELAYREGRQELTRLAMSRPDLRYAYICAKADINEERGIPVTDEWEWIRGFDSNSSVSSQVSAADIDWLLQLLSDKEPEKYRLTAFYLLQNLLRRHEKAHLAEAMLKAVEDSPEWRERILSIITPQPITKHPSELRFDQEQRAAMEKLSKERARWKFRRQKALANPSVYLTGPRSDHAFAVIQYTIQNYLKQSGQSCTWSDWDADFIEKVSSADFLARLRTELWDYWRTKPECAWNDCIQFSKHLSVPVVSLALMALKSNAETPGWENSVSPALAIKATKLVLEELDASTAILSELESVHPHEVYSVFKDSLNSTFEAVGKGHSSQVVGVILRHGSLALQYKVAQQIATWLEDNLKEIKINTSDTTVANLFTLVKNHGSSEARAIAMTAIRKHLWSDSQTGMNSRTHWLRLLSEFNFQQACEDLLLLSDYSGKCQDFNSKFQLFAAIFNSSRGEVDERFTQIELTARLNLLHDLLVRSYAIQQILTDKERIQLSRSNKYSYLELIRATLLNSLTCSLNHGSITLLHSLSQLPELSEIHGIIRQKATDVAATLAEPAAMDVQTFRLLESTKTYQAHDRVSLFNLMKNRLNDFEHDLLTSQFSIIHTIRRIPHETELRNFISHQLHQSSKGAYTVNQEAVVVGEKRTDIRLQPGTMQQYATIELKLTGENHTWTAKQLAEALTTQLVRKYLSNQHCQVGCLLICMQQRKHWLHPVTYERMDLTQTVAWLQQIANDIMATSQGLYLWIKGIDYAGSTEVARRK